jgi:glutamate formiminotransferase/formiminotetrahydrofolate cyclodeaminase
MEKELVACVPNFSEGRNPDSIASIKRAIESVKGVKILHTDIGFSVNRTVITFVGPPQQIVEAAFLGIYKAYELIDMSKHTGTHPRMGAVDVCPFVPLLGVTMEETIALAEQLAAKVAAACYLPVFRYEKNASLPHRIKLSQIRFGEYEGWFQKIKDSEWKPDFGPAEVSVEKGILAVGARDIMLAYNVNLRSKDESIANKIARELRESGYVAIDNQGNKTIKPGLCKGVRAIGWYIPEFQCAQVSMNLMDLNETSWVQAFDTCKQLAAKYGVEVSGSELVGMVPESVILATGNHFLAIETSHFTQNDLVSAAVAGLGLSDKVPFVPEEKIIEWRYNTLAI